jgi:hypothetical protein
MLCHLLHAACMIPQCMPMAFSPQIITVLLKYGSTILRSSNANLTCCQYVS